jgi:hypothetical protein
MAAKSLSDAPFSRRSNPHHARSSPTFWTSLARLSKRHAGLVPRGSTAASTSTAGVIPVWVAVAQVPLCDGPEFMDEGYLDGLIAPTLFHFDMDIATFEEQVRESMADMGPIEPKD